MVFNFHIATYIQRCFPKFISLTGLHQKSQIDVAVETFNLFDFARVVSNDPYLNYETLFDLWIVDNLQQSKRFQVNYSLATQNVNVGMRLITHTPDNSCLNSVTPLFKSGNWPEREAYDLFGVFFDGHPDLRRILTDYGFQGYPMRKDFPLSGYTQVRYDDETKKIVIEPVKLSQEFRNFNFMKLWKNDV